MNEAEQAYREWVNTRWYSSPREAYLAGFRTATERAAEILENVEHPGVDCARVIQGLIDEIRQQGEEK